MRKLRILALHGAQQNSELFSERIRELERRIGAAAELVYLDAPHQLPRKANQDVAMLAWWRSPGIMPPGADPPGALDWDAQALQDWQEAFDLIVEACELHAPVHGVLGFSNGAAAAALIAANAPHFPGLRSLQFAVCIAGYLPQPLDQFLTHPNARSALVSPHLSDDGDLQLKPASVRLPSFHCFGARDEIVPPEASEGLAAAFADSPPPPPPATAALRKVVHRHAGSHVVPQSARDISALADFLQPFHERLASTAPSASHAPPAAEPSQPPTLPRAVVGRAPWPSIDDDVAAELDALRAIYDSDYRDVHDNPPAFAVCLREPGEGGDEGGAINVDEVIAAGRAASLFRVCFVLPAGYPAERPHVHEVIGPFSEQHPVVKALREYLSDQMDGLAGSAMIYQLVEAAREWLQANVTSSSATDARAGPRTLADRGADGSDVDSGDDLESASNLPRDIAEALKVKWWESDEADASLIRQAAEYAARLCAQEDAAIPEARGAAAESEGAGGAVEGTNEGRWDFVIGLVGKPSAGKSTFFNAITVAKSEEQQARIGAFPFTTIEPNIGRGYVAVPDPCGVLGLAEGECCALYGHEDGFQAALEHAGDLARLPELRATAAQYFGDAGGERYAPRWRRVPVTVKDVAGLVPGAYKGLGKGNAFLNDLNDADVLIHVVDASASTTIGGAVAAPGEGSDPMHDVQWVHDEVHQWIYTNVRRKWRTVIRNPARLGSLFSGYRASRRLVAAVLHRAGVPRNDPEPIIRGWRERELHRLVAVFLQMRFPTLLALNKADHAAARPRIEQILRELPHQRAVPVSALAEATLRAASKASPAALQLARRVQADWGHTGVALAAAAAMALKRPGLCFPVTNLQTLQSLNPRGEYMVALTDFEQQQHHHHHHASQSRNRRQVALLRDCVVLHPGSTARDVHLALKKPPFMLLEGDYVRAEATPLFAASGDRNKGPDSGDHRPTFQIRKTEPVTSNTCVLRIMTNKRST